ncbi:MAG: OmpA family protein [Myxococcota bacterium]
MMSISLLFTMLTTSTTSHAADSTFGFGISSGALVVQRGEVIGDAVVLNPRISFWPDENVGIELDVSLTPFGQTQVGTPDTFDYFGVLPAANFVGRVLVDQPINLIFNVGAGPFIKSIDDNGALGLPFDGTDIDFAAIAGPGLLVPLGPLALRGEVRWLVTIGSDNFENEGTAFQHAQFNLGLMWLPIGPKDEDKDGVADDVDRCLGQPEDIDTFQDEDGCPDEDNDEDGRPDVSDTCPLEAEDIDEFEDEDGCPDDDNDDDGLLDKEDRCPNDAGTNVTEGCPDSDEDLVADLDDECDFEAGQVESYGCIDTDGDLVPDYRDECPEKRAPKGIDTRRADGCVKRAYIGLNSIITVPGVSFDSRQRIKKASLLTLDDTAKILNRLDGIKRLEVQTHTDSTGDDEENLKESQKNADTIIEYLVGQGVDPARIEGVGYGETKPIADNETESGRRQNNRIIFAILEQVDPKFEQPKPGEEPEGEEATPEDESAPE